MLYDQQDAGTYDDKFSNLKAGYSFMLGHPGKKLLFMGQDFGQLREWSEERELDWYLLAEEKHSELQNYVRALLHLYQKNKALYDSDQRYEGFEWINANDNTRSIFQLLCVILRMARTICSLSSTLRPWPARITG